MLEWNHEQRVELPVLRGKHDRPPCFACEKVPDRIRQRKQRATSKADAINLSQRNTKVYSHWKGCQATNDWPRDSQGNVDAHVKRHAGIIADLLRQRDEQTVGGKFDQMIVLLSMLRVR